MASRAPKQSRKVPSGLRVKKMLVMPPPPRTALKKLVSPKAPPRMAPDAGPMTMAPTATGMVSRLSTSGPTGRYPSGV